MPIITNDKYIDDNGNEYEFYDDGVLDYLPTYADRALKSGPLYGTTYNNWIGFGGVGSNNKCHYPGSSGRYRLKIVNNFPHNNVVLFLNSYIYGNFISGIKTDKEDLPDRNTYRLKLYAGSKQFALCQSMGSPNNIIICSPDSKDPFNPIVRNEDDLPSNTKLLNNGIQLARVTEPILNGKNYYADFAYNQRNLDYNLDLICDLGEISNYNNYQQYIYFAGISYYIQDKVEKPIISYSIPLLIPFWEHYLNYFPGSVRYDNNNSQDWYSCNRTNGK